MSFFDLFSNQASLYAEFRPEYPPELFAYLAGQSPGRARAVDIATGNGQAAIGLSAHFQSVLACDASPRQLAHARSHPRVSYFQSAAEQLPLTDASLDLATVAQAVHWFDFEAFYAAIQRVLRPGGVLALWMYYLARVSPEVDAVLGRFYTEITGPYWHPRRRWIDDLYRNLPFPFREVRPPSVTIQAEWQLRDMIGFLSSWSAAQAFQEEHGYSPLREIEVDLLAAWGDPEVARRVEWPLSFRIGIKEEHV